MKFGLTDEQYNQILEIIVKPLMTEGAKVYCYGSRARGDHQKFSDVDLMVESSSKDNLKISDLIETIQNSNFPFKVDLVHISEFAESYKESYLKDRIEFKD